MSYQEVATKGFVVVEKLVPYGFEPSQDIRAKKLRDIDAVADKLTQILTQAGSYVEQRWRRRGLKITLVGVLFEVN